MSSHNSVAGCSVMLSGASRVLRQHAQDQQTRLDWGCSRQQLTCAYNVSKPFPNSTYSSGGFSVSLATAIVTAARARSRWKCRGCWAQVTKCAVTALRATVSTSEADNTRSNVVVFSRAGCRYCSRAKALLRKRGIFFNVVDVGKQPDRRAEAAKLSGAETVPQIFVGGRHVGDYEELAQLDKAGSILDVLSYTAADGASIEPTPPDLVRTGSTLEAHLHQALMARADELRASTFALGSSPSLRAYLRYKITGRPSQGQKGNVPLNACGPQGPFSSEILTDVNAADLVALLRQAMLQLLDDFADPDSGDVDYIRMKDSSEWFAFRALAVELGYTRLRPDLLNMAENERKAFLINLYNAMTFHGIVSYGRKPGKWGLYCFFTAPAVSYVLAGTPLSLDDVEHGLLRAQADYFSGATQEFQRGLRMPSVDPRIHMALNCGARGCPAVAVYDAPSLDTELDAAVAAFVADDSNVCVTSGGLAVTMLFKWYFKDFVGASLDPDSCEGAHALTTWIVPFASPEKRRQLTALIMPGANAFSIQWLPYDWETNGPEVPIDKRIYTLTW